MSQSDIAKLEREIAEDEEMVNIHWGNIYYAQNEKRKVMARLYRRKKKLAGLRAALPTGEKQDLG